MEKAKQVNGKNLFLSCVATNLAQIQKSKRKHILLSKSDFYQGALYKVQFKTVKKARRSQN